MTLIDELSPLGRLGKIEASLVFAVADEFGQSKSLMIFPAPGENFVTLDDTEIAALINALTAKPGRGLATYSRPPL